MASLRSDRKGNAMIEFVLVGIPIIFILISVFELARGMWLYHTAAYALKEGARFAIVRGNNCNLYPNNCAVSIAEISARIRDAAVGFLATDLQNVTFDAYNGASSSNIPARHVSCATLAQCLTMSATYWPAGAPGTGEVAGAYRHINRVEISAVFPFQSAVAMLWPGAGTPIQFGTFLLPASSKETMQY